MRKKITIQNKIIGSGEPVYIIAEMSANHQHEFDNAVNIIKAAKEAGADAVKLQTYTADTLTIDSDKDYFKIGEGTIWEGRTLYDLYREACTPWEWFPKLQKVAEDVRIDLFSSPFDSSAVEFLEKMGVPVFKIASFELIDLPLIKRVAQTGKPVIMSTGMATENEIKEAVEAFCNAGGDQLALLKCTSAYPATAEEMNLNTIPLMMETFDVPVGLSDHSLEMAIPVAATALGASIIEKHFILDRSLGGPDSAFSLEPDEFREMVRSVRITEKSKGGSCFGPGHFESSSVIFRRSLFAVEKIEKGEMFTEQNVRSIRPGHGLKPKYYEKIIGRKAALDIERGTPLRWDLIGDG